jgi:integrase
MAPAQLSIAMAFITDKEALKPGLIMCNTGMRPPEARNLRWRDITAANNRDGRAIVVLTIRRGRE